MYFDTTIGNQKKIFIQATIIYAIFYDLNDEIIKILAVQLHMMFAFPLLKKKCTRF